MPYPVSEVISKVGYELVPKKDLRRPAITYPWINEVRFRPGRHDVVRVGLAHELGHIALAHPADRPHWCVAQAWQSPFPEERHADAWALDYLLPENEIVDWLSVGSGLALSELARKAMVPLAVARRQLRRLGHEGLIWDDEGAKAEARRHPFFHVPSVGP